jgi:hypothetical protein
MRRCVGAMRAGASWPGRAGASHSFAEVSIAPTGDLHLGTYISTAGPVQQHSCMPQQLFGFPRCAQSAHRSQCSSHNVVRRRRKQRSSQRPARAKLDHACHVNLATSTAHMARAASLNEQPRPSSQRPRTPHAAHISLFKKPASPANWWPPPFPQLIFRPLSTCRAPRPSRRAARGPAPCARGCRTPCP